MLSGLGIAIVSTSQGLLTDAQARERRRRRRSALPGLVGETLMSRIGKNADSRPQGRRRWSSGTGRSWPRGPRARVEQPVFDGYPGRGRGRRSIEVTRPRRRAGPRAPTACCARWSPTPCTASSAGFKQAARHRRRRLPRRGEGEGSAVRRSATRTRCSSPSREGIKIEVDAKTNRITVTGTDQQKVGQTAAEIRGLRKPDPYKGKGIKYTDEVIRRKVGKAGGK